MQPDLFGKPKPITLAVKGNVPSFKNCKMLITKGPNGRPLDRPLLITKPELQTRMAEITESLMLQLLSTWQTEDGRTLTGCSLRSLIALCVPDDDCWTRIPRMTLEAIIDPENEGATITIERL